MEKSRSLTKLSADHTTVSFALLLGLMIGYLVVTQGPVEVAVLVAAVCTVPLVVTEGIWFLLIVLPVTAVFWIPVFRVGTYNVTALFLVMIGLAAAVILRVAMNRTRSIRHELALIPLALLPLVFGIVGSALTIGSIQNVINGILIYTVRFAVYAVLPAAFALSSRSLLRRAEIVLAWSLLIGIGYSVVTPVSNQLAVADFGDRASGLFYNPNVMGDVAVLGMNWALAGVFDRGVKLQLRFIYLAVLTVAIISMLRSGSRSALVAAGISLAAWGYTLVRSSRALIPVRTRYALLLSLSVVLALAVVTIPQTVAWTRVQEVLALGVETPNVAGRLEASRIGLNIFASHPLGIGIGNIPIIARPYSESLWYLGGLTTTDNQFLEILIESGIPGLLSFLVVLVVLVRRSRAAGTLQGHSVAVSIVAMSVAGLAAFTFYSPFISSLLWMMYSIAVGKAQRLHNEGKPVAETSSGTGNRI